MTDAQLAAHKAAHHNQFVLQNTDNEFTVTISIPVKGYERAVAMFDALVLAANPLVAEYEEEVNDDIAYSAYVLDDEGGAVY